MWKWSKLCRKGLPVEMTFPYGARRALCPALCSTYDQGNCRALGFRDLSLAETDCVGAAALQNRVLLLRTLLETLTSLVHEHWAAVASVGVSQSTECAALRRRTRFKFLEVQHPVIKS